jgi:hypothetical protein
VKCYNDQERAQQQKAAERLNVSSRSVASATKVRDGGVIELQRAVERGDVAVSSAAEVDDDEQRKVIALALEIARRPGSSRTMRGECTGSRPAGFSCDVLRNRSSTSSR